MCTRFKVEGQKVDGQRGLLTQSCSHRLPQPGGGGGGQSHWGRVHLCCFRILLALGGGLGRAHLEGQRVVDRNSCTPGRTGSRLGRRSGSELQSCLHQAEIQPTQQVDLLLLVPSVGAVFSLSPGGTAAFPPTGGAVTSFPQPGGAAVTHSFSFCETVCSLVLVL